MQPNAPMSSMGPSWTPLVDDAKVWAAVQDALAAFAIDPKKPHVAGFSQGGAMTWRMVCKHADVIASATPVAGAYASSWTVTPPYVLDCPFTTNDSPSVQIPILKMHGSADAVIPFAKGTSPRDALLKAWEMTEKEVVLWDAHYTWKPRGCVQAATRYIPWADLLRRVYALDALACPKCGGKLRMISLIMQKDIVHRIRASLGLLCAPPVLERARAPTVFDDPAVPADYDVA